MDGGMVFWKRTTHPADMIHIILITTINKDQSPDRAEWCMPKNT